MGLTETVTIVIRQRGARATSKGITSVGAASRTAARSVGILTAALAAMGIAASGKGLLSIADEAIELKNKIRVTTRSTGEFNAVLFRLREISAATRSEIGFNARLFQRFSNATKTLGTSQGEVLTTIEGLNAALAVTGTTGTEATAGLIQLGQGLAKSTLDGDELRSVMENIPELGRELADEMGLAFGQLKDMGAEGKLQTKDVWPALSRAAATFRKKLDDIQFTSESTFKILKNEVTIAIGAINETLGATEGLNEGIIAFSKTVGVTLVKGFAGLITGVAAMLDVMASWQNLLNNLGIKVLPNLSQQFSLLGTTALVFIQTLEAAIHALNLAGNTAGTILQSITHLLGTNTDERFAKQIAAQAKAWEDYNKSSKKLGKTLRSYEDIMADIAKNGNVPEEMSKKFGEWADNARKLADNLKLLVVDGVISIEEFTGEEGSANLNLPRPKGLPIPDAEEEGINFGEIFAKGMSQGLSKAITGDEVDFWQVLADTGADLFQPVFEKALLSAVDTMKDAMKTALESTLGALDLDGLFDGLGAGLGDALGAAVGIGLGLLGGALKETTSKTTAQLVKSAVKESEKTRGVIAGPTNIPIFEVGSEIESAFQATNSILRQILAVLEDSGATVGTAVGSGGGAGTAASTLNTTPSLA